MTTANTRTRNPLRNNYTDDVNFASNLHNTVSQIPLPLNSILRPYSEEFETSVIIEFIHPDTAHTGHIMMINPVDPYNFIDMLCAIDRHNGYFMEIIVDNLEEMLDVIAFSQQLLPFQPDQIHLDYVRVPEHMLNHWCVPHHLRALNS